MQEGQKVVNHILLLLYIIFGLTYLCFFILLLYTQPSLHLYVLIIRGKIPDVNCLFVLDKI